MIPSGKVVSFDPIADLYDESRFVPADILQTVFDWIFDVTDTEKNSVILDVGIGTGMSIAPILSRGAQLYGVDVSSKMLAKSYQKLRETTDDNGAGLIRCDASHIPFRAASFDLLIAFNLIGFLPNQREFLKDAKRVLKNGGYLVSGDRFSLLGFTSLRQMYWTLHRQYTRRPYRKIASRMLGRQLKRIFNRLQQKIWNITAQRVVDTLHARRFSWVEDVDLIIVLNHLQRRSLPAQWSIPTRIHDKIMEELNQWIRHQPAERLCEKVNRPAEEEVWLEFEQSRQDIFPIMSDVEGS